MPSFVKRIIAFFFVILSTGCGSSSLTQTDETGSAASTVTADPASLGSVQTVTSDNYRAVIQQSFIPAPEIKGKNFKIRVGALNAMNDGGKE